MNLRRTHLRGAGNRALASVSVVLVAVLGLPSAGAEVVETGVQDGVASAVSGDFDGDGRTDLALTGASRWTTVPVARTGSSGFTVTMAESPAFAAAAAKPGVKVVTEDFDGDQDDDIVLVGGAGETTMPVARSNRDGTFAVANAAAGSFPTLAAQPGVRVVTGDFNNDDRPDLALTGSGLTTIPVAFSGGTATFTATNAAAPEFAQQVATAGTQVLVDDFDGDGRTDLVAVPDDPTAGDHSVVLALSNGDGTFRQVATPLGDFVANVDGSPVSAADLNDDGSADLAVATRNRFLVAYSTGDGAFDYHEAEASDAFYTQAALDGARIFDGDYNCDGRDDVVVFSSVGNASTMLVATGTADPDSFTVVTSPMPQFLSSTRATGAQLLPGDYNNDGCDDFAVTGGLGVTTIPMAISASNGLFTTQNPAAPDFATWATGARPAVIPPPPATTLGRMTLLERLGRDSAVAIGTDGLPIVAYHLLGSGVGDLQVAHCADIVCTAFTNTTSLDTVGWVGRYPSIKIGTDGLPLISYVAESNNGEFLDDLKVAHCNDIACTSATFRTLDFAARVAHPPTLTIGADGLGLIAYDDTPGLSAPAGSKNKIKVAHCLDVVCTSASKRIINEVQADGNTAHNHNSRVRVGIATGALGFGVISYFDPSPNSDLWLTTCQNADCSVSVTRLVDDQAFGGASVTVGLDGLALISYVGLRTGFKRDLKVVHCTNPLCTAMTKVTVDDSGNVGNHTEVTTGGDGFGVIAYYDHDTDDLKMAHCVNLACGAATTTTVDDFDDVGSQAAIASGTDGLPLITYLGPGTTGLIVRIVHCGNSDCTAQIVAPF